MAENKYSSEILGEFLAATRFGDFPASIIAKTKEAILDAFGCMLGGSTIEPGQVAIKMVGAMGGEPEATVVAHAKAVPMPWAAYANAYLANLLDYDDTYGGVGHPGGPIIAAAYAAGEKQRVDGKAFLSAVILGYETAIRIGEAVRPSSDRAKIVFGQGTFFVYGAAAAAGKTLGFDGGQFADTLTLAGTHAPVPTVRKFGYSARPLSWIKNNLGWASMGGVMAAKLVEHGFHGNRSFFDGDSGFWIMASSDQWRPERMVEGLGESYGVGRLSFKPYTSCRYIHTSVDGLRIIMQKHNVTAADVRRVIVKSTDKAKDFADYAPTGPIDGQFSLPYVIAMTLLGVPTGHAWQNETNFSNQAILDLAKCVEITQDPDAEKYWRDLRVVSTVGVELADGRYVEESVLVPRGDPDNPMSYDELVTKFIDLAEPVVGRSAAEAFVGLVERLETVDDISILSQFLATGRKEEAYR